MRIRATAWAIVLFGVLGGCQPAQWSTIEQGGEGGFKPSQDRYLVLRDSTAWAYLHHWAHADSAGVAPTVPVVDFGSDVVLACLLSQRPSSGYSVHFTKIEWNQAKDQAKAFVKEAAPVPGSSVGPFLTYPYAFARLTADPLDTVQFVKNGGPPIAGMEMSYRDLVEDDLSNRNPFALPAAPAQHLPALSAGKCPLDGTTLAVTPFTAEAISNGYAAIFGFQAHFCPKDGVYWTNGSTPSSLQNWSGPFHPGVYWAAAP